MSLFNDLGGAPAVTAALDNFYHGPFSWENRRAKRREPLLLWPGGE